MAIANNPFDLNTTTGAKLLGNATAAIAAPQTTGYNAATAGGTGYLSSDANPFGYKAGTRTGQGYEADKAGGFNWNVGGNQTVQGQIGGIIASNSPLLQQARANSLAQMNSRGLVNSSMAVGEGEKAVYSAALPIATQDAATYANSAQLNANAANQLAQFNANAGNQALGFTSNAANQAGSENLAASNQGLGFSASAANQASLNNANAFNQAAQFTANATNNAALSNAAAQNQAAQFSAGSKTDVSKQYATALNSTVQNMMDQSMKYALSNADAQTKIELQNIDASTRAALASTEATYKNQMQASASSTELFQQMTKNIADIMGSDLSADPAKGVADSTGKMISPMQAAVNIQKQNLSDALAILSVTSGVTGLKALLTAI